MATIDNTELVESLEDEDEVPPQYLTFMLSGSEYGLDILAIQEIRRGVKITEVPNTPEYVQGVINLRGLIVPVISPRELFGLKPVELKKAGIVIVLKLFLDGKERVMGLLADSVSDVYVLREEDRRKAPEVACEIDSNYVEGLASIGERVAILLDANRFMEDVRFKKVITSFGSPGAQENLLALN